MVQLDSYLYSYFFEGDSGGEYEVGTVSFKQRMWFLFKNEHNISWHGAGRLVTFPGKSYFSAGLPAGFDVNCEHLVFGFRRATIRSQHFA